MRRPPPPTITAILLGLLLAGLVGSCVVVWLQDRRSDDRAALAVAREGAQSFFSLDHRQVEQDVDAVLALATGTFRDEYSAKREAVIADVRKRQVVVTATIPEDGAALEFLGANDAQVLVSVDVRSQSAEDVQDSRFRTRMTLQKVEGEWLVSGVEQVG